MVITRRQFTAAVGSLAWPTSARAQQAKPAIGYLSSTVSRDSVKAAFHRGLNAAGFTEGKNVEIEYRSAEGRDDRLPALASDLVKRRVSVIAALGGAAPGLASKAATSAIPIVFQTSGDPVRDGLVASLNRPGGNVTGATRWAVAIGPKSLELLHEAVPNATAIALLLNPRNPIAMFQIREMEFPAGSLGLRLRIVRVSTERELEAAFPPLAQLPAGGLVIANDSFLTERINRIVTLAAQHRLPAIYSDREHVAAGGLMSYGPSLEDSFRQAGVYVGRILKGAQPADLPVVLPTVFEFVLNLKTAKSLGLDISPKLRAFAHEVIE